MLLTPRQKLVFRMHHKQGIPQVQIARTLRIRPESVCRILARANQRVVELSKVCGAGDGCGMLEAVIHN